MARPNWHVLRRCCNRAMPLPTRMARARHYGARAIDALAGFPNGPAKTALTETVEFAIARAY